MMCKLKGGWIRKGIMMWKLKGGWKRWHYDVQIKRAGWIRDIMMCKLKVDAKGGIMMCNLKGRMDK